MKDGVMSQLKKLKYLLMEDEYDSDDAFDLIGKIEDLLIDYSAKEVGRKINDRVYRICSLIDQVNSKNISFPNMDVLVKNECMGIQELCAEIGVTYYED